jgi:hypothetical protein
LTKFPNPTLLPNPAINFFFFFFFFQKANESMEGERTESQKK